MSTTRSLHFPPAAPPPSDVAPQMRQDRPGRPRQPKPDDGPKVNPLEAYSAALRDVELVRERLRSLLVSENRHGDLQAARTAARRLDVSLTALIDAEEV